MLCFIVGPISGYFEIHIQQPTSLKGEIQKVVEGFSFDVDACALSAFLHGSFSRHMQLDKRNMKQPVAEERIEPCVLCIFEMLNHRAWYATMQGIPNN